ncbi:MAG: methionyl-tRNA formyltransferase [Lachnospiraceae bacterium]|nr:methionyl-tRNA formyltransferase [Lachnospiraceae bacterium]
MRIIFMGTPDFSVPTLEKLYSDSEIEISYVVTKADTKSNRGQKINFSDVKKKAMELGIDVLQPISIKDDREVIEKLKEAKPDFIIVVAYGQILSKEILDIPKYACINGHASLLPKYRGASPIQSAILNGDKVTGTTSMLMDVGLDTGDMLLQKEITIDKKETSDSLFEKLSYLTADVILDTINNFDNINSIKQDDSLATKSVIIKKEFGKIDFKNETKTEIDRKIRAYTSWPSAFIEIEGVQYKIWDTNILDGDIDYTLATKFGEYIYILDNKLYARCKDGFIEILELQKSGKNRMKSKDFINGLRS